MTQELMTRPDVRVAPISKSFDEMMRVAETLLKSGFLPYSIKTPAQAVAIILMGREVGLPEMQALRAINVIQGKPTLSAELMLALFSARVNGEAEVVTSTDTECTITFKRPGRTPHTRTFTLDDAKRLGFATKDNYSKQPATMLQWRCVSAGLRFYAPDALAGISYTPDELGAVVNPESGEVINTTLARGEIPMEDDVPAVDVRADVPRCGKCGQLTTSPTAECDVCEIARLEAEKKGGIPTPTPEEIARPSATEAPKPAHTKRYDAATRLWLEEAGKQKRRLAKEFGHDEGTDKYYQVLWGHKVNHADEVQDRETRKAIYAEWKKLAAPVVEQGELV